MIIENKKKKERKIVLNIHDYDRFALINFRSELLHELDMFFDLRIYCAADYFGRRKTENSDFNFLIPYAQKLNILREIRYRSASLNQGHANLIFGIRTCVLMALLGLTVFKKSENYLLIAGLGTTGKLPGFMMRMIGKILVKFARKIIVLNEHDRNVLGLGSHPKLVVLPSEGIDLENTSEQLSEPVQKSKKILYIGRILPEKGIFDLIERLSNGLTLDIYGYGPCKVEDMLEKKIINHPNVTFYGRTERPLEVMQKYNVAVFPSVYNEGFPMVILEAILAGCIPICCNIPQLAHLYSHVPELKNLDPRFTGKELEEIVHRYNDSENNKKLVTALQDYTRRYHSKRHFIKEMINNVTAGIR